MNKLWNSYLKIQSVWNEIFTDVWLQVFSVREPEVWGSSLGLSSKVDVSWGLYYRGKECFFTKKVEVSPDGSQCKFTTNVTGMWVTTHSCAKCSYCYGGNDVSSMFTKPLLISVYMLVRQLYVPVFMSWPSPPYSCSLPFQSTQSKYVIRGYRRPFYLLMEYGPRACVQKKR